MSEPRRRARGTILLAVGIVSVEFATAVSRFVASTLLPVVAPDLGARNHLGMLIAGASLGLFVAIPLAGRVLHRLGSRGTLAIGVIGYVVGLAISAAAPAGWVFALGQFASGTAGGLLALFGISAAIRHLDESMRVKVVAVSASMWILPALVGPVATLGLEHLIGWRWSLLVPAPIVLLGRFLIVRAIRHDDLGPSSEKPVARMLLIPAGAAAVMFGSQWWPLAVAGLIVAVIGVFAAMPPGSIRLARGVPSALVAMMFFGIGYFGADSLITILLTDGYRVSLGSAAIVLSSAPLAWGVTSLGMSFLWPGVSRSWFPAIGLSLAAASVLSLAIGVWVGAGFAVALCAWTLSGIGVGLAYPQLYVLASSPHGSGFGPTELAAAVITAEGFGDLIGRTVGGAISSIDSPHGLTGSYGIFAVCLAFAVFAATRSGSTADPAHRRRCG